MGVELLEIGVKMRKGVILTIRGGYKTVRNHPFLVGMLCFLFFLYRSSPFIFSFLVSASPVLICTALLLGTLLSYGQSNIPEIEVEDKTFHEAVSLKTGMSGDATVVHENDSYYVERYSEKGRDEVEQVTEQPIKLGEVRGGEISDDAAPLIEERSRETDMENGEMTETDEYKQKAEWYEGRLSEDEIVENHYSSVPKENDENVGSDDERSEADSFDSETVNVDSLDSPPRSPWKRVEDQEEKEEQDEDGDEGEEEDDDALDSGSDRAESSSPDASLADIMPMLDELHPLLEEDAPQPVHMSMDARSERSSASSASSHESDEESENQEDLEVGDDDNEDGDDEEDAVEDKEEQTKSAITWTEEDQKNLMDLGTSEIERNQRLENLILRRRAKKNLILMPERNLIDLESSDLPFNIAPISTARQNPFDSPRDAYNYSGLPPIPGSAPSIMQPRRNPFDIPYDSSEEKPNLMGDELHDVLTTLQSREQFFRRYDSFHVGPSIFAPNRQERQDGRLHPYFVPEESSFSRQSSGLSDSKASSVPETESLGSVEDLEDRKLNEDDSKLEPSPVPSTKEVTEETLSLDSDLISTREQIKEDVPLEPTLISEIEHVSEHVGHGSQSSVEDLEDRKLNEDGSQPESSPVPSTKEVTEEIFSLDSDLISSQEQIKEEDVPLEPTLISEIEHVSEHVGHGSQSSVEDLENRKLNEDDSQPEPSPVPSTKEVTEEILALDSDLISSREQIKEEDVPLEPTLISEIEHDSEHVGHGSQSSEEEEPLDSQVHPTGCYFNSEGAEQRYSRDSSSSSLSEVSERVFTETDSEEPSMLEERMNATLDEQGIPTQISVESSDLRIEVPHIGPVYDSSPPSIKKNFLSSSISSDVHAESEGSSPKVEDISNIEVLPESSVVYLVDEPDSAPEGITDTLEHDKMHHEDEVVDTRSVVASFEEDFVNQHAQGQVSRSISDENVGTLNKTYEDPNRGESVEDKNLMSSGTDSLVEEGGKTLIEKEETIECFENHVQSPNSDSDVFVEASEKLMTPSAGGSSVPFFYDKPMNEPSFKRLNEEQERDSAVISSDEVRTTQELNLLERQHVAEPNTSESTNVPQEQVLDAKMENHVKTNSVDEKVQANKVDFSVDESNLKEIGVVAAKNPEHEVEALDELELTSSDKGNSKKSPKSSSSSSSTSSESELEDLHVVESNPSEGSSMPREQVVDTTMENHVKTNSVTGEVKADRVDSSIDESNLNGISIVAAEVKALNESESTLSEERGKKSSKSSSSESEFQDLHVPESNPSEGTSMAAEQVLDAKMEHGVKTNSVDGEVIADKVESSMNESDLKEISVVAAEKPEHEVKALDELESTSSDKRKGKKSSKSSSSSSSSSSESSSSDSDGE